MSFKRKIYGLVLRFGFLSLMMLGLTVQVSAQYIIDFEGVGEFDNSYATSTVNLNGLDWEVGPQALIWGSTPQAGDMKNGNRSARLRFDSGEYGTMTMMESKMDGLGSISFYASRANFSGDRTGSSPVFEVEYSTEAPWDTWESLGSVDLNGVDTLTLYEFPANILGEVRVRFRQVGGSSAKRWNLDDITLNDYLPIDFNLEKELTTTGYIGSGDTAIYRFTITNNDLLEYHDFSDDMGIVIDLLPTEFDMPVVAGDNFPTTNPDVVCQYQGATNDPPFDTDWTMVYPDHHLIWCFVQGFILNPEESVEFEVSFVANQDLSDGLTNKGGFNSLRDPDAILVQQAADNFELIYDLPYNNISNAVYNIPIYTILFDENESTSGVAPVNQLQTHGVDILLAENIGVLERAGFTFGGWNTLADGTGVNFNEGDNVLFNQDITLFARWVPVIPSGGGSGGGSSTPRSGSSSSRVEVVNPFVEKINENNDLDMVQTKVGEYCLSYDESRDVKFNNSGYVRRAELLTQVFYKSRDGEKQYLISGFASENVDGEMDLRFENELTRFEFLKVLMLANCMEIKDYSSISKTISGKEIKDFADLPRNNQENNDMSEWMNIAYSALYYELIEGTEEGKAEIDRALNSAELVKILVSYLQIESEKADYNFSNPVLGKMLIGEWYAKYFAIINRQSSFSSFLNNIENIGATVSRGNGFDILVEVIKSGGLIDIRDLGV